MQIITLKIILILSPTIKLSASWWDTPIPFIDLKHNIDIFKHDYLKNKCILVAN